MLGRYLTEAEAGALYDQGLSPKTFIFCTPCIKPLNPKTPNLTILAGLRFLKLMKEISGRFLQSAQLRWFLRPKLHATRLIKTLDLLVGAYLTPYSSYHGQVYEELLLDTKSECVLLAIINHKLLCLMLSGIAMIARTLRPKPENVPHILSKRFNGNLKTTMPAVQLWRTPLGTPGAEAHPAEDSG